MNSVNLLIKNIRENPEEWTFSHWTANNSRRKIKIWIANGVSSCCPYEVGGFGFDNLTSWSFLTKLRVWIELKKVSDRILAKSLEKSFK